MPDAPQPFMTFDFIPKTLEAVKDLAPYMIVFYAIWSANHGASRDVWTPLLVAGAALINPPKVKSGDS